MITEEKKALADRFGITDWDGMREVDWIILAALADLKDSTTAQTINIHNAGASFDPAAVNKAITDGIRRSHRAFTEPLPGPRRGN